jgi:hypothetical protein
MPVGRARGAGRYEYALGHMMLAAAVSVWAHGCGNVQFIDAPFAPRHISIRYSAQEDVTVIRWRMSAPEVDPDVGFQLLGGSGAWSAVDFSKSVFAGGVTACGDGHGLCAQLVLAGQYVPPVAPTVVRAVHPTYGLLPGNAATVATDLQTLSVQPSFQRGNLVLLAPVTDAIGGDGVFRFPRPLESAIWERLGVCVPGYHPDGTAFSALASGQQQWPAPAALSADGHYCASVRGLETDGAPGIDAPVAVDTLPEVVDGDALYTVPTELTPFTYQIVLDLSIPVADRCAQAMQLIESTVAGKLGGYTTLRELPALDLSAQPDPATGLPGSPCRQSPARSIDAAQVAQAVKLAAASWPEQHQRFFLLYFDNLRAALPDTMTQSLSDFRATIMTPPPPVDFAAYVWAFGPPEMTGSFAPWDNVVPWLSAEDLSFPQSLDVYGSMALPLISEIEDQSQPIPILSADDAGRYDGAQIRLCATSVTPADGGGLRPIQHDAGGQIVALPAPVFQWQVRQADPPAYLLSLPEVWAVTDVGFTPHQAHVSYEICTRYCDHAFTAESGAPVADGWLGSDLCMGPPGGGGS